MDEQKLRQIIRDEINRSINKTIFKDNIQIMNNRHIQLGRTTGTKIGTQGYVSASDTGQKIGFFDKVPVIQLATVSDPAGGATVDTPARTAIIAVIDALQLIGLMR